ncbi:hypothetical protein N5D61_02655 [Pseudomonas sp. GD03842]|uniref:hypothetical protein n=1 Tax=Pseudomonas sp. GD03842 TaxID=2975385 RepID=UPI0024491A85|nr:hypothetical protein [Pseudomonas sp. GD03842]MDH0745243.1 hypothetical protein [Pseudomonas sp. GD03842]
MNGPNHNPHKVEATIFNLDESGPIIALRLLPYGPITPAQARDIGRQIIQAANAADQGEVGTYPQEG